MEKALLTHPAVSDVAVYPVRSDMMEDEVAATVVAAPGKQVKFGATVRLIDEDTEDERTYQIVGENEADVKQGKVSITSPIARALISKKVGDTVEVNTPGGGKSYEILKIEFI